MCGCALEKLGEECEVVIFTKPVTDGECYELEGIDVHKDCKDEVKVPDGWELFI